MLIDGYVALCRYDLVSVITHRGTMFTGHYVIFVRVEGVPGGWLLLDDKAKASKPQPASMADIVKASASSNGDNSVRRLTYIRRTPELEVVMFILRQCMV